ncbi:hypothetical protein PMAYCL1PPCAC_29442, partial [Pristionchus mayeri]
ILLLISFILPSIVISAPSEREEKRLEMKDYIIFRFAMEECQVPSECHERVLTSLRERTPPYCDTGRNDLLPCLKREIHSHRGSSSLPLDLDPICCSFPSAGPLCPEVCKSSLRSISMTPLQIHDNIVSHCSSLSFSGDSLISECIQVARHLHSRKEKDCGRERQKDE